MGSGSTRDAGTGRPVPVFFFRLGGPGPGGPGGARYTPRVDAQPILRFLKDFLAFLATRKRYWLLPAVVLLVLMGLLLALTQGAPVAPLIYAPR